MIRPTNCPPPDLLLAAGEGVLPPEVASDVQSHLKSCPTCAQLRDDLASASLAEPTLEELERLRQRVVPPRRNRRFIGAAAAAAAIVLGVLVWRTGGGIRPEISRPVAEAPRAAPYRLALEPAPLRLPLAAALVLRGKPGKTNAEYLAALGDALAPYREGKYPDSALRLAALEARYPKAVEPPFYRGVSLLLAGDTRSATAPLERARQIGGEALERETAWYLAISRERAADWNAATPLLEELCTREGEHSAAACKALGRQ